MRLRQSIGTEPTVEKMHAMWTIPSVKHQPRTV